MKAQHERAVFRRQIAATDEQIDRLVYELYGLSEDEIAIVGGSASMKASGTEGGIDG